MTEPAGGTKDPASHNAAAWITKAESDLRGAANNVSAKEPAWDVVCFHAQQAAEKYLKAALVARGQAVPRTHDLGALLGLVTQVEPSVTILASACATLEPYAVRIRYPDDLDMPDRAEGSAAMDAARRVREVVRRVLKLGTESRAKQEEAIASLLEPTAKGEQVSTDAGPGTEESRRSRKETGDISHHDNSTDGD